MNALWWWIDRWRKSTAYTDMTLEEQGAYRNLLDEATLRGGALPNDERILAKACGDALRWRKVRTAVLARFELRPDGWHNETLNKINQESERRAAKQKRYRQGKNGPSIQAIQARDGAICGICTGTVDPMNAEIDHIIPVSREGHASDVRNLQFAHATCNQKKGSTGTRRHESLLHLTAGLDRYGNAQSNKQSNEQSNGLGSPDPYPDQEQRTTPLTPLAGGRQRRLSKLQRRSLPYDPNDPAVVAAREFRRAMEASQAEGRLKAEAKLKAGVQ